MIKSYVVHLIERSDVYVLVSAESPQSAMSKAESDPTLYREVGREWASAKADDAVEAAENMTNFMM